MQLKLLGIAGTTSISATAAAIKGLSKEEAIAALATTELNETEMAAALVKAGYTNATATQTAALAVEAREQEAKHIADDDEGKEHQLQQALQLDYLLQQQA